MATAYKELDQDLVSERGRWHELSETNLHLVATLAMWGTRHENETHQWLQTANWFLTQRKEDGAVMLLGANATVVCVYHPEFSDTEKGRAIAVAIREAFDLDESRFQFVDRLRKAGVV